MSRQKVVRSAGAVGVALALTVGMFTGGGAASAVSPAGSLAHQESPGATCDDGQFFLDVAKGQAFFREINRLGCSEVSTGFQSPGGRAFLPKRSLSREAMAAFLYRWGTMRYKSIGGYPFEAPAVSPFADVQPGDKFYREIAWLHHKGIATGTKQKSGKPFFQPKDSITREAMAAFMTRYILLESEATLPPRESPFEGLSPDSRFYKEITYLEGQSVTNGYKTGTGREFRPKESITREAMAAFLMRVQPLQLDLQL